MAEGQIEIWQKRENNNITVEAVRLNEDNVDEMAVWSNAEKVEEIDPEHPAETQTGLNVWTPTGVKRASLGMYLVLYGRQFFVSHNRNFETVYTPVNREDTPLESAGDSRKARGFADPFDTGRMGP